jgi:predicted nucleic acid-binding protein
VEVPTAIWRKHRLGELPSEDAAMLVEEFEWDWFGEDDAGVRFAIVAVTNDVLDIAARSAARHPLRAFDAVQLASALASRAVSPDVTEFACFDVSLAAAARAEGFALLPRAQRP